MIRSPYKLFTWVLLIVKRTVNNLGGKKNGNRNNSELYLVLQMITTMILLFITIIDKHSAYFEWASNISYNMYMIYLHRKNMLKHWWKYQTSVKISFWNTNYIDVDNSSSKAVFENYSSHSSTCQKRNSEKYGTALMWEKKPNKSPIPNYLLNRFQHIVFKITLTIWYACP